jgi:hypothetical protein
MIIVKTIKILPSSTLLSHGTYKSNGVPSPGEQ